MTDGEPLNPYAAPLTQSEVADSEMILLRVLQTVPTLRFANIVTHSDLRDALATTGMRSDLISKRTIITLIVIAFGFMIMSLGGADLRYLAGGAFVLSAFFVIGRLLMLRKLIQVAAATLGPTEGEISPEGLVIRKPLQTVFYPLKSIIAVTSNRRRMVFVFDQSLNHFETIKFVDFDNPIAAEAMVDQLRRVLPPRPPVVIDDRRQTEPMQTDHFQPSADAIFFGGAIQSDDLRGTTFELRLRQSLRGVWIRLTAYFGVVGIGLYFIFGQSFPMWVFIAVTVVLYGLVFRKMRVIRKSLLGKNETLWQARGWIEPQGIAHVSAIGQSYSRWTTFEAPEDNGNSMVMKYQVAPMWIALTKGQLHDPDQWPMFKQRVHEFWQNAQGIHETTEAQPTGLS